MNGGIIMTALGYIPRYVYTALKQFFESQIMQSVTLTYFKATSQNGHFVTNSG